jgi:UDP-N-acetylmuramoylalanine--D-glutamate ligase
MSRTDTLQSWHADWRDLRVVVLGLGVTGFSVADTLAELGAKVLVVAEKADAAQLDILDVLGVEHLTGSNAVGLPREVVNFAPELVITSPGVKPEHPLLFWASQNEIDIWVDIELAWRVRDKLPTRVAKWVCITGTNGKTTTAQLVEGMLSSGGLRAVACGNIGVPILDAIREPDGFDALVVELSSFQLHYLGEISPVASAVLNVADDHLDWHGDFKRYAATKAKIYEQTQVACVYNFEDLETERMVENADVIEGARAIGFTLGSPTRSQVGYVEDLLCDRAFLDDRANSALEIATLEDIANIGVVTPHLLANVAAATALARSLEISPADIRTALLNFKLDAHRIELVAQSGEGENSIRWIDDSKATNPHAAAASLASFEKTVWVVGGLLKGVDISPLVSKYADRLRAAIVIGADRSEVLAAFEKFAPHVSVFEVTAERGAEVMSSAVELAANCAQPGDVVLLAPAAASMDQFKDYADRGNLFAEAVKSWVVS